MRLFLTVVLLLFAICCFGQPVEPPEPKIAKIVCIGPTIVKPNCQDEGDVVGVFNGDHEFSPTEKAKFRIIEVRGMTKGEIEAELAKSVDDPSSDKIKKFAVNASGLTQADVDKLSGELVPVSEKLSIFSTKITDNSKAIVAVPR